MSRRAFLHQLIAAALLPLAARPGVAGQARVIVVRAEDSVAVDEFLGTLRRSLSARAAIEEIRLAAELPGLPADAKLVIPVGVRALRAVVAAPPAAPVLAALVPRQAYERVVGGAAGKRFSAIFLDQPFARQFALLSVAFPERRRVGVLLGSESRLLLSLMQRPAEQQGLVLVEATAESERALLLTLQTVLAAADVLLAVPDPAVHNSGAIQNILLAAYRRGVPVVGFSPAYTRAGALLSLHSSPSQLAEQVASVAADVLAGQSLPTPRWPRDFQISVNRQVARSMAIDLPEESVLVQRLRQKAGSE